MWYESIFVDESRGIYGGLRQSNQTSFAEGVVDVLQLLRLKEILGQWATTN